MRESKLAMHASLISVSLFDCIQRIHFSLGEESRFTGGACLSLILAKLPVDPPFFDCQIGIGMRGSISKD